MIVVGEEELGLFVAELGPLELAVDVASLGAHLLDIDDAVVAFASFDVVGDAVVVTVVVVEHRLGESRDGNDLRGERE